MFILKASTSTARRTKAFSCLLDLVHLSLDLLGGETMHKSHCSRDGLRLFLWSGASADVNLSYLLLVIYHEPNNRNTACDLVARAHAI